MLVSSTALETSLSAVKGGQTTTSMSLTLASSILSPLTKASASATVLFIFQLPAIINFRSFFIGCLTLLESVICPKARRHREEPCLPGIRGWRRHPCS